MTKPRCVITGVAQGIGRALAEEFGRAGYAIFGIDVDQTRAEQAQKEMEQQGIAIEICIADLASEPNVTDLLQQLSDGPPIQALIHNAGINHVQRFASSELAVQEKVLRVNLFAPVRITRELMQADKLTSESSVIFISSLSHFTGYPGAAVYAASKDGLAAFAESLREQESFHVLTVFPGPTRTEHARRHSPDNRREHRRMAPGRLAQLIFQSAQQRRSEVIPGFGNQVFASLGRWFPWLTEWALRRAILEKISQ